MHDARRARAASSQPAQRAQRLRPDQLQHRRPIEVPRPRLPRREHLGHAPLAELLDLRLSKDTNTVSASGRGDQKAAPKAAKPKKADEKAAEA